MLRAIQKLLGKEKEIEYDKNFGYLTKEDIQKLRDAAKKPASPLRKKFYSTWICGKCGHMYFYMVFRCPLCESRSVEERANPVRYEIATV